MHLHLGYTGVEVPGELHHFRGRQHEGGLPSMNGRRQLIRSNRSEGGTMSRAIAPRITPRSEGDLISGFADNLRDPKPVMASSRCGDGQSTSVPETARNHGLVAAELW